MCLGRRDVKERSAARSRRIDLLIQKDEKRLKKEVKLLLLGAGESGKTTVLRQMRLIYTQGIDQHERMEWKPVIFDNLVHSFRTIAKAMTELGYEFDSEENEAFMETVLESHDVQLQRGLPKGHLTAIKALWLDGGVAAAVRKGNEYGLDDNLAYFIANVDRIWSDGYVPDNQDLLRSRSRTVGIHESKFEMGKWVYRMVDVGGQRSERKKWIHCFQNVHCLLFLVAISGYNQCMLEEAGRNQMTEALLLWESIANSYWFTETAVILFLNKMDLFVDKLPDCPISEHGFPDYDGPSADYKLASKYILGKFRALVHDPDKQIYGHFTNATDTNLLKITMVSVQQTIIQRNLSQLVLT